MKIKNIDLQLKTRIKTKKTGVRKIKRKLGKALNKDQKKFKEEKYLGIGRLTQF